MQIEFVSLDKLYQKMIWIPFNNDGSVLGTNPNLPISSREWYAFETDFVPVAAPLQGIKAVVQVNADRYFRASAVLYPSSDYNFPNLSSFLNASLDSKSGLMWLPQIILMVWDT